MILLINWPWETAVGMLVAFTPTAGVQMVMVSAGRAIVVTGCWRFPSLRAFKMSRLSTIAWMS